MKIVPSLPNLLTHKTRTSTDILFRLLKYWIFNTIGVPTADTDSFKKMVSGKKLGQTEYMRIRNSSYTGKTSIVKET